jgi:hypothetical protein
MARIRIIWLGNNAILCEEAVLFTFCLKQERMDIRGRNSALVADLAPNVSTSVGEAQSLHSLTTDWTTGVRSQAEAKDFSSSLCVQTGSEAHPASYGMGTGSFPLGKSAAGA